MEWTQRLLVFGSLCLLFFPSGNLSAQEADLSRYAIDLDDIVVTASRIEQQYKHATQNISIVSDNEINASGATEITEVLGLLPSVDVLDYGSFGSSRSVHMRGASSSQVLTLIDGRPVNTPRDGTTDFNQISLSTIERIEVLRGPASSIYGANAVGGVINVITKRGREKMQTELLTKSGSFHTKLASFTHGYKINDFDYFISYDYLTSHGHRDNADYLSHNANTKFGYQLNDDNHVSVSSGYYTSEVGTPGLLSNVDLDDRQETYKKYVDIAYEGHIAEGQDIAVKLFHNFDRLEFIETFNPIDKDTHQAKVYGVDAQFSQELFDFLRSSVGISYQEHRLNSSTSGKHIYNLKGVYVESEIDIFDTSSLKVGARWDDYSNFGDRISPSVSFYSWLCEEIKLHALLAKSFRGPTFNDLYWPREDWGMWGGVEGNSFLGPEKATSYEAGISYYVKKKFKADVTLFKTELDDLIEWTVDDSWWWRPENISSATIKGVELEAQYALRENLKANFNYTYLETKNKETKKWLIYRPRHLYKIKLIYSPSPKYEICVSGIYKTKRFVDAANTRFLKHFFVVNFNASYKLNDFIQILFEAKNITDQVYQEQRDYPMPPRAFYGGLKLTF